MYAANPRLFEGYSILWISCQFLIIITLLYMIVIMFSLLFVVALFFNDFSVFLSQTNMVVCYSIGSYIHCVSYELLYYQSIILFMLLVGEGFHPFCPYPWPRCHRQPICVPWPRDRYGDQKVISSLMYRKRDVCNPTVGTMKL